VLEILKETRFFKKAHGYPIANAESQSQFAHQEMKVPATMQAVVYRGVNDMRVERGACARDRARRVADQSGDVRHLRNGSEKRFIPARTPRRGSLGMRWRGTIAQVGEGGEPILPWASG